MSFCVATPTRLPGVGRPRADRFSRLLNRLSRSFLPDNGDSILEKGNPRVAEAIRAAVEKKQLSLPPLPASFFQVNEADRAWSTACARRSRSARTRRSWY
jgi:hypothetical protein